MTAAVRVLLATTNPAKAARLGWLLEGLAVVTTPLPALPPAPPPGEDGASFAENARIKALHWSHTWNGLTLASDGGVTIPALGPRWDRLLTGRAAGPNATDADRARHLLELMEGHSGDARAVTWTEALCLARAGTVLAEWEAGGTRGLLTSEYDPAGAIPGLWVYSLWQFPDSGRRYVDLTQEERAAADHTWTALRDAVRGWWEREGARPAGCSSAAGT